MRRLIPLSMAFTFAVFGSGLATAAPPPKKPATPASSAATRPAAAAAASEAGGVQAMLDGGALRGAYNPVVLSYLMEEGRPRLSAAQHKQAVEQLVAGFRSSIDIKPGAQVAAGLATAVGMLAGGVVGQGISQGAYEVWRDWVDAAVVLARAGYQADATRFFEYCISTFPDDDLRSRCAAGLAAADAERGFTVLMGLLDGKHALEDENVALRLLGTLAGAEGCPQDKKDAVLEQLTKRASGMMNTSYAGAVVNGLAATRDPRAVETLRKMTKGLREDEVKRAALRALVLDFHDAAATDEMVKKLKKSGEERFLATSVLVAADHDAGFEAALADLTQKKKGGLMRSLASSGDQPDHAADLVAALARAGGEKAKAVLVKVVPARPQDEWVTAYAAVTLLELGDQSAIEVVRKALAREQWPFTRMDAAVALAHAGDRSGVPVLATLIAAKGGWKSAAGEVLSGRRKPDPETLRSAAAEALGRIDHADAVPLLLTLLDDRTDRVRTSAALALASMTAPAALEGLAKALTVDYGKQDDRPRNPVVHARVVRAAARVADPRAGSVLAEGARSSIPSVKFLALAARKG
jgi:HEAT repeat protein